MRPSFTTRTSPSKMPRSIGMPPEGFGDQGELLGPIQARPSEDPDPAAVDAHLHPVAVELDLTDPSLAVGGP